MFSMDVLELCAMAVGISGATCAILYFVCEPTETIFRLPQIHEEEYPKLKARHEADVDEFAEGLDKAAKFYFKLVFRPDESASLKSFLREIGAKDQSNMDFGQLAAYLEIDKSKRYKVMCNESAVVWKTSAGKTRYAFLVEMCGGFEWSKFFKLVDAAKSSRLSFRQIELTKGGILGNCLEARMHFKAAPVCGV